MAVFLASARVGIGAENQSVSVIAMLGTTPETELSLYIPILPVRGGRPSALATVDDLLAEAADAISLGQITALSAVVLDLEIVADVLGPVDAYGVHFAGVVVALRFVTDAAELADSIAGARPVGAGQKAFCRGRGHQEGRERDKPRDLHGGRTMKAG